MGWFDGRPCRFALAALLVVIAFGGWVPAASAQGVSVSLYNGPPVGTWRPISATAQRIIESKLPGVKVNVEPGGPVPNMKAVNERAGRLGMVSSLTFQDALAGKPPFEAPMLNVRELVALNIHPTMIFAPKGAAIQGVPGLKGKRVGVMPKIYAQHLLNLQILKLHGMGLADVRAELLGEEDTLNALRDGRVDAAMFPGYVPQSPYILELATVRPLQFFSLDEANIKKLVEANRGLQRVVIPPGTYPGQDREIVTVAFGVTIVAHKDFPEDLAEKITAALVEGSGDFRANFAFMKDLTPQLMALDVGLPYHPGTLRYYRAKGLVK